MHHGEAPSRVRSLIPIGSKHSNLHIVQEQFLDDVERITRILNDAIVIQNQLAGHAVVPCGSNIALESRVDAISPCLKLF